MAIDLEAIKARAEKAVPGPWGYDGMHYEITAPHAEDGYWIIASECRTRPDGPYECDQFGHEFDPTFDFIAHAREDVPALVAEIERLYADNDRMRRAWEMLGEAASANRQECINCHLLYDGSRMTRLGLCINCAEAEVERLRAELLRTQAERDDLRVQLNECERQNDDLQEHM